MSKSEGFTLIEIVVTIGILGFLGVVFANTLAQGLRGQTKATVIGQVRQTGQFALDTLDRSIRGADLVICISNDKSTLTTRTKGIYNRYRFVAPALAQNPAGNGYITSDIPTTFSSTMCEETFSNQVDLTNRDAVNGVSISGGQFDWVLRAGFKDLVKINFTAQAGSSSIVSASETQVQATGVPFTTTIEVR